MTSKTIENILSKKKVIFFFFLFLVILPFTCAEILTSTTEKDCLNSNCVYSISQSDRFLNYNGKWLYFNQFATLNIIGNDLIYTTPITTSTTPTTINLSIYVTQLGRDMPLNSLTTTQIRAFNPVYTLNKGRDEYKFNLTFTKAKDITRIGFKINSNREYLYTTVTGSIDNVISNNVELSLQDLKDSGYIITLDKVTGIYWIDISNRIGTITLDPVSTFYSLSNDGGIKYLISDGTCSVIPTTTTTFVGENNLLDPNTHFDKSLFEFNTTTIASDQQVDYANFTYYVSAFSGRNCLPDPNTKLIYGGSGLMETLDCSDDSLATTYINSITGTTTGFKTEVIPTTIINKTNDTILKLEKGWTGSQCDLGTQYLWTIRTSEYAGVTYDPILTVVTSTTIIPPSTTFDEKIERVKYPILLIFIIIFVMAIMPKPKNVI